MHGPLNVKFENILSSHFYGVLIISYLDSSCL